MGKVVTVWGPTGAPGRTTIAINLAAELAELGHRVLLIDGDTYGGTIAPYLGIVDEAAGFAAVCRLAGNAHLADTELQRLSHQVATGKKHMSVLTGIVRSTRWPELSAERITAALDFLRDYFDYIVADVGFNLETDEEITSDLFAPRRNAATLTLLKLSDHVVEVAGADAMAVARFIRAHNDFVELFPEANRVIVLNKVRGLVSLGTADPAGTLARYGGLTDLIQIRWDEKFVHAAIAGGKPLTLIHAQSGVAKDVRKLVATVVGTELTFSSRPNRFARSKKTA